MQFKLNLCTTLLMAILAIGGVFASCGDDDNPVAPAPVVADLKVDVSTLNFSQQGGTARINVQSSLVPTVTSDAAWLEVKVGETSPNLKATPVTLTCSANDGDDRKATVTVSAGGLTHSIAVSQSRDLTLVSVSPDVVPGEGGQAEVKLVYYATPVITIDPLAASWLSVAQAPQEVKNSEKTSGTLVLNVEGHYGAEREGKVTITVKTSASASVAETVTIRQAALDRLDSKFDHTAMQLASMMYPGWNLGNTMEAAGSGLGAETSWQSTKTSQEVIDFVKAQGFRSIRIPCSWYSHMDSNHVIDAEWMARVKAVVDYCINDGLYVVLNDHYDTGWLETKVGTYDEAKAAILKSMWTQIGNAFVDYGEYLLFAGLNEPNADSQAKTDNLVKYEQVFVDAVRATGGNNAMRTLLVQGPSTDIDNTNKYYKALPTDAAKDRMMVEVHFYSPWNFCGMEKDESWGKMFYFWGAANHVAGSSYNANWGEEQYLKDQMKKMKTQFVDKGIPVYIGEYSCLWREVGEHQAEHDASVRLFHELVVRESINNGCVPVLWDPNYCQHGGTKGSMSVLNRSKLSVWNTFAMEGIQAGVASGVWPY